ncbi:MAG TPA: hypothetical protein PLJ08_18755 [Cyclobacteriaceae bacterium]|nr:hypothetical protein [Cyclobacteriaceae bacterium]
MDYLIRLWNWIREGKYFYFFVTIIFLTFQLDKIESGIKTIDSIRYMGLVLQLIGTSIIIYSLRDKLQLFKGHGLIELFINYFKGFPLRKRKIDSRLEGNAVAIAPATGHARLIKRPKEDLKEVIEHFQNEINELHKMFYQVDHKLITEVNDLNASIHNIKNRLTREINDTKVLIKESFVSNIWLDSFGLACLFWGIFLGTAPDIVEKLI